MKTNIPLYMFIKITKKILFKKISKYLLSKNRPLKKFSPLNTILTP